MRGKESRGERRFVQRGMCARYCGVYSKSERDIHNADIMSNRGDRCNNADISKLSEICYGVIL